MRAFLRNCLLCLTCLLPMAAGAAPLEGYTDHAALEARLAQMAQHPSTELMSIGTTAEGRDIHVLRIGGSTELLSATGDTMPRPAIAVFGNVQAQHLAGREVCLELAQRVLDSLDDDEALLDYMQQHDFYFIPSPVPDATEYFFRDGAWERGTNSRPQDDDLDGRMDEDPGEDLNGDGILTMMRVADSSGDWMEHPDDARVLIRINRDDNEQGSWRLLSEGTDNDGDEQFNEDGPGGVDFNRNMTFNHQPFRDGAGPWPVSEEESRAVVDWLFDNPQVFMVLSYSGEDNIRSPWKSDHGKIQHESAEAADISVLEYISEQTLEGIGKDNFPGSDNPRGSFADWAYFHMGAWSISLRPWWLPEYKAPEPEEGADGEDKSEEEKSDEKRGADEINALNWFAAEGIDGFVDWTEVQHPDFPGRRVEVGGFRPYLRSNPPAQMLDGIVDAQLGMLMQLCGMVPKIVIRELEVEDLGEGLFRVTAHVANDGYLPTSTRKAENIRKDYPLNIALELPQGASLLTGALRGRLGRIEGGGAEAEHSWLVMAPQGGMARVVVASTSVGMASGSVELGQ